MSEEKLKSLVDKYPDYSDVLESIFDWFKKNQSKNIRASQFYTSYSPARVNITFYILNSENVLNTVYRVIDYDGTKIGMDFKNVSEIPDTLDNVWGDTILKKDASIVPFYMLNLSF